MTSIQGKAFGAGGGTVSGFALTLRVTSGYSKINAAGRNHLGQFGIRNHAPAAICVADVDARCRCFVRATGVDEGTPGRPPLWPCCWRCLQCSHTWRETPWARDCEILAATPPATTRRISTGSQLVATPLSMSALAPVVGSGTGRLSVGRWSSSRLWELSQVLSPAAWR